MKTKNKLFTCMLLAGLMAAACNKEDAPNPFEGTGNHITSFVITKGDVSYTAAVAAGTITLTVPVNVSLNGAAAEYQLCENATIAPDPATITNWDSEQQFAVTAYNGTKTTYIYTVERSDLVHNGVVILKTQAEVDAFGQNGYTVIDGTLVIGAAAGTDTITSLAPLAGLKMINGGLVVNATYKGDLTGFEQLETVGDLRILSKDVKIVRFPELTAVRLDMDIDQAAAIETLDCPYLTVISRNLRIYYADSLAAINFPNLQRVLANITIEGRSSGMQKLQTVNFPELTGDVAVFTLKNLSALERVNAPRLETATGFELSACHALTGISISTLTTVSGNLSINTSLASLSSLVDNNILPALATVNGNLSITASLASFNDISFLPALATVNGNLSVSASTLTSLRLPALAAVKGTMSFDAPLLATLELPSLKNVGTFTATELHSLGTLDVRGIEEIGVINFSSNTLLKTAGLTLRGDETFKGTLSFVFPTNNATPASSPKFPLALEGIKKIGGMELAASPVVTICNISTVEFNGLEEITGLFRIVNYQRVPTVNLPDLKKVGSLVLTGLNYLTSLQLPALEEITGYTDASGAVAGGFYLTVAGNRITTLSLPSLKSVVGNISITGLATSYPLATISFPELTSLTGTLTLTGTNNAAFTDLSGFSKLTSATGVTISGFTQLKNFEPLKNVIPSLSAATWKISGCGYNPTYQNMLDGSYTN